MARGLQIRLSMSEPAAPAGSLLAAEDNRPVAVRSLLAAGDKSPVAVGDRLAVVDIQPAVEGAHSPVVVAVRIHTVGAAGWDREVAKADHSAAVEVGILAVAGTVLVVGSLVADRMLEAVDRYLDLVAGLERHTDLAEGAPHVVDHPEDEILAHLECRMKNRWRPTTSSIPGTSQSG